MPRNTPFDQDAPEPEHPFFKQPARQPAPIPPTWPQVVQNLGLLAILAGLVVAVLAVLT